MTLMALLLPVSAWSADYDKVGAASIKITNSEPDQSLIYTVKNLRALFQNYELAIDDSTTIKSPLQVGGTPAYPNLQVTVTKCVAIVCLTATLVGDISVSEVSGPCERNLRLTMNLQHSDAVVSDNYDNLEVAICLNGPGRPAGTLDVTGYGHHARNYSNLGSAAVRGPVFDLLKLQVSPLTKLVGNALNNK